MSFSLFLDEQVDVRLATLLRREGFDALTTQEAGRANQAISDEDQLTSASSLGRALFTHNVKDFEPLARTWTVQGKYHTGIIVSELRPVRELYQELIALFDSYPEGIAIYVLRLPRGR